MTGTSHELSQATAAQVRHRWGLADRPLRHELGVNKGTWRIGSHWLSADESARRPRVERLRLLLKRLHAQKTEFDLPTFVAARDGRYVHELDGRIWWVTTHVRGRHPKPSSEADMVAVARGLADLHAALRRLPRSAAVSNHDAYRWFELGATVGSNFRLPFRPADRTILGKAEARVRAALPSLPRDVQLVHGDPSNPNLRLSRTVDLRLTGVLDLDEARVDDPLTDLATVAQTVVLRSGRDNPLPLLDQVLDTYAERSRLERTRDAVLVSLLMAKFESVATHGTRFLDGAGDPDLVASQPAKVKRVLDLLD